MRIGEVIGSVTLNRSHPGVRGGTFRVVVPLSLANLTGESDERADPIVVYDELGSGEGSRIAVSEGREAAQPFHPERKPIDAYCAAILDQVNVSGPK